MRRRRAFPIVGISVLCALVLAGEPAWARTNHGPKGSSSQLRSDHRHDRSVGGAGSHPRPVSTTSPRPGKSVIDSIEPGDHELVVDIAVTGDEATNVTARCGKKTVTAPAPDPDPIVVTGLTNGKRYRCTGYATDSSGRGPKAKAVWGTPKPVVPSEPPIVSVDPGEGSLTVNYGAAQGFGLAVVSYTATCGSASTTVGGSTLTDTVSGLTVGGSYSCTLYATDSKGNSPSVAWDATAGPPQAPEIHSILSQDDELTVEFETVVNYPISYTATCGAQSTTVNGDTPPTLLWATVTGLSDGTAYTCTVVATNTAGTSPASSSVSGTPNTITSSTTPSGGGVLLGVSCPSTSECVAVGAGGGSLNNTGLIEVSTDGGKTFSDEPVPAGTPQLNAVSCVDVTECLAVGGSTVLVSSDGGATWSYEFAAQDLSAVACISATVCVAGGWSGAGAGFAAVTSDGGSTWQEASGSPALADIACASPHCFGVGPSLAASTDNGQSWQEFGVPGGYSGALTSVACLPTTTTCIMVGSDASSPVVFVTTDEGEHWSNDASALPTRSAALVAISCPTATSCVTDAESGDGVRTDDGGQTWSLVPSPTGVTTPRGNGTDGGGFQNLSCASSSFCVGVGAGSAGPTAAYTTNGATTWSETTSIG